jgi:hypothetical protein
VTRESVEGRQRELRFAGREAALQAKAGVPPWHSALEAGGLQVAREQQQREAVSWRDRRQLGGERPRLHEAASRKRTLELAVDAALRGHERMFACAIA